MPKRRSTFPGILAASLLLASCSGGEGTGPAGPEQMQKTAGDNQTGVPGAVLAQPLEVKVTDGEGRPVVGFTVSFSASSGSVNPQSADTDNNGRARTTLTLPAQEGTVTVTASGAGVPEQQFTAQATAPPIVFTTTALLAARRDLPYSRAIQVTGGTGSNMTFSLSAGALPAGLVLDPNGSFSGSPTATGSFQFTVRVSDGFKEGTRQFNLQVCDVPAPLAVGAVTISDPMAFGACGVFLPAGNAGDRYRVGVVRTSNQVDASDLRTVTVTVTGNGVTGTAAPPRAALPASASFGSLDPALLARYSRMLQATAEAHARSFAEGEALVRRLGAGAVLGEPPRPLRAPGPAPLPPTLRLDVGRSSSCTAGAQVTALLIAEDDRMGIYQDSAQNASASTRVTAEMADLLLAYYRDYGQTVIESHFGVPGDIDGNEKVIVFITPSIGANTLGLVWSGNFFSKADCPASNAAEMLYLNYLPVVELVDPELTFSLALHALVHETKHVSSMYQRILRAGNGQDFHPQWEEEGGAEIAAERAARLAWSEQGGPPVNAKVAREHLVPADESVQVINSDNIAMLFMLLRTQETLSEQPNSVVVGPSGTPSDYVYGSGWLFLRFLGDAYGNAGAAPMADASFFLDLHSRLTTSGPSGITSMTGKSWTQLMEEYVAASMVNGQPDVAVPRAFTSYDFVSAIETYCFALDPRFVDDPRNTCKDDDGNTLPPGAPGAFPWPVTTDSQGNVLTRSLATATYAGTAMASGIRVHDFTSNGSGAGAEINVDVTGGARVVVVRLR